MHFNLSFDLPSWLLWFSVILPLVAADISDLFREVYDETVVELWTKGTSLANKLMQWGKKIQANTRAVIIPRYTSQGGDAKGQTFDGDAYAAGTNPTTDQLSLSSIGISMSFSGTELMNLATRSNKVAIRNWLDDNVPRMTRAFKEFFECLLNAQDNDGIAARLSGVQNTTEYILDSASDPSKGYLLMEGMRYQIIAATGFPATVRANGPHRIAPEGGLNKRLNPAIVQFWESGGSSAAAIAGFTAEDRVVWRGLGNAGINPLRYHVSGSASGTWQGGSRSLPYNRSTRINGGSNRLTPALVQRLLADILKYSGEEDASEGLVSYSSFEQIVNWKVEAQAVTQIRLDSSQGAGVGEIYDRMLGDARINRQKPIVSNRANPTEFRFIRPSDFRWVTMKEIGFIPNVAGGKLHANYNGDGEELSSFSFILGYHGNLGCANVMKMGVIDTLSVPILGE